VSLRQTCQSWRFTDRGKGDDAQRPARAPREVRTAGAGGVAQGAGAKLRVQTPVPPQKIKTEIKIKKLENPADRSRNLSKRGGAGIQHPPTGNLISDCREGRAIPDLRGSSVLATEPFPRGHHHPAEPLLLFHIVTASTLSWKTSITRTRGRSCHNSESIQRPAKRKFSFLPVLFP
jgi:hypothetical protein